MSRSEFVSREVNFAYGHRAWMASDVPTTKANISIQLLIDDDGVHERILEASNL